MASSSLLCFRFTSPCLQITLSSYLSRSLHHHLRPLRSIVARSRFTQPLGASRRFPNYSQEAVVVIPGARPWISGEEEHSGGGIRAGDGDDDEEDEDDDDEDRSLDLLVKFLHNVFRKISRRARKAVRTMIPSSIPTKLVGFSVNGVLILAFLWILKAFLEVVCTFGSMVFISILVVRGIWAGVSYMKENNNQYYYSNRRDDDNSVWAGVRPAD